MISRSTIVAAVSGGIDSCVLLHKLHWKCLENDTPLIVVHVDHQLRPTSGEDAAFVGDLCATYRRTCHVVRICVHAKGNRQAHARSQRYAALARLAHDHRTRLIATGHHAHDQLENEQIRHVMGRFGDLLEVREMPQWDLCLWRPLIAMDRPQIRAYAEEHALKWREDESNRTPAYLRNRIRDLSAPATVKPISSMTAIEPVRIAAHRWWVPSLDLDVLAAACRFVPGIKVSRASLNTLLQDSRPVTVSTHGGLLRRTPSGFEIIRTTGQGTRCMPAAAMMASEDVRKIVKMNF